MDNDLIHIIGQILAIDQTAMDIRHQQFEAARAVLRYAEAHRHITKEEFKQAAQDIIEQLGI